MKKLLGLLAVVPMALTACGGTKEDTPKDTDTKVLAQTSFYLGHGKKTDAEGVDGAQNDEYNVIQTDLYEDGGTLSYEVNESTGYQTHNPTGNALAVPVWTEDTRATVADDFIGTDEYDTGLAAYIALDTTNNTEETYTGKGVDGDTDYVPVSTEFGTDFTAWQANNAETGTLIGQDIITAGWPDGIEATKYYANTGESLRYVYAAVEIDEDDLDLGDDGFVNKSDDNYGSSGFVWDTNRKQWNAYLNKTYDTCKLVEAVTAAELADYAETKQSVDSASDGIAGSTAGEAGLYIAASLTTAAEFCAE